MKEDLVDPADHYESRKWSRHERKKMTQRDRSKYKKTDQAKEKEKTAPQEGSEGIILSVQGLNIFVSSKGEKKVCTLRGTLKKETKLAKNLIVVGDRVSFDREQAIEFVYPRRSVLSRADHLSQQKEHPIAANVDQVFITTSVVDPLLRPTMIDRYLVAAEKGNISPIIVCNKVDLLDDASQPEAIRDEQRSLFLECKKLYHDAGYLFLSTSYTSREGLDQLKSLLHNKISVFSGQSGTGKSSLLNAIAGFNLKIGETVQSSKKGAHTTSFAQLLPLPFGGFVVDTPGIKSFGIWNISPFEVRHFFKEIDLTAENCKFTDCFHRDEEGCAVREAVSLEKISKLRYNSYLSILSSLELEHLRR